VGRREDLETILVIGSGPIVIGQACEFDYSGTQACRALRAEGYRVVLANSNPATVMTDPELADRTYVEPLDVEVLAAIVARERPDALLATMGGQTALNLAMDLIEAGVPDAYGVELIGARAEAIRTAEDRERFKLAMLEVGLKVPASAIATRLDEAMAIGAEIGYPLMIRPSFILGGAGTGIAADEASLRRLAGEGLKASPVGRVLVERSIAGWKEFELEVMRDVADNCVVVCSIENLDPMGVHTGDSVTVAPAQTLADVEYQQMRDAAFTCMRRVGVETGGSNVQFAVDPTTGEQLIIEMNPRVSRSSALASKATGFPIAKIATLLAVGYRLDEIRNAITGVTPASFEPTIDYVVTKVPRWAFEKLPGTEDALGTRMQSVGEVMAIGRSFPESLQKALRGLERGRAGLNCDPSEADLDRCPTDELVRRAVAPTPDRLFQLEAALRRGLSVDELAERTKVDPWFLDQIRQIVDERHRLSSLGGLGQMSASDVRRAKRLGFGDAQLAYLLNEPEEVVRAARLGLGVRPTYKTVDTCAAEFAATTPYLYSAFEEEDEVPASDRPRVVILGSGPNRIGQGIEFDYCCVHASLALREAGFETVMVNCNPETVSTDYDTSDRLYFEPITVEDVLAVIDAEQRAGQGGVAGVIVGLGGQTPLSLAGRIPPELVLGTSAAAIDLAEDRERWSELLGTLGICQPAGGMAADAKEALAIARRVGFPVLVRPSYVLGGRAMEIAYDGEALEAAMGRLALLRGELAGPERSRTGAGAGASGPVVLVDHFLEDAIEVDVDAIRDHLGEVLIGGVLEHVEEAGVHSGDSACAIPPPTLRDEVVHEIERQTARIAAALGAIGPINVQFAVQREQIFVIEANPRASRTLPFVAKATGVPLAKVAALVMAGKTLDSLRRTGHWHLPASAHRDGPFIPALSVCSPPAGRSCVKQAVLPFDRFPELDRLLGPEMRSTGEVMGIDTTFGRAFAKSQLAGGSRLPTAGTVLLSLADRDKPAGLGVARSFAGLGFAIAATQGTAHALTAVGLDVATVVAKVGEPRSARSVDAVELIASGAVGLVVNTPRGSGPRADGRHIRREAARRNVVCLTSIAAARAAAEGIAERARQPLEVRSLQEHHGELDCCVGDVAPASAP
jgi:carbamoyl-phosphate synthase large subunit